MFLTFYLLSKLHALKLVLLINFIGTQYKKYMKSSSLTFKIILAKGRKKKKKNVACILLSKFLKNNTVIY